MRDTTDRTRRRLRDWLVDAALFVFAASIVLLVARGWATGTSPQPPAWLVTVDEATGVVGCLALWWRRRWPVPVAVGLVVLSAYFESVSGALVVGLFTVAVHRSPRVTGLVLAACLAATGVYQLVRPDAVELGILVLFLAVVVGAVGWGLLVRSRRQLVDSLRDRAVAAETEARLRAERTQHEARETLAREMHDVLGHRLSLLSVHAGALAYHRDASAEDVARVADVIRDNAHRALQDLREVIGVLRAPVGEMPLPSVADIVELVADADRAGTPTDLRDDAGVTSTARPVPETTGRTLYRIVQEGLTNVRKHASGAPVVVRITGAPGDHLAAEIVNERPSWVPGQSPNGSSNGTGNGTGNGLRGLTERAVLVGGRLDHGPTDSGGWRIAVWLPWPT